MLRKIHSLRSRSHPRQPLNTAPRPSKSTRRILFPLCRDNDVKLAGPRQQPQPTKKSGAGHNTARVDVQALRPFRCHTTLVLRAESAQRHEDLSACFLRFKSHSSGSEEEMVRSRKRKLRERCICTST